MGTRYDDAVVVTSGLIEACGITYFAERLASALRDDGVNALIVKPKDALGAGRVIINFEYGVMSTYTLAKIANSADSVVVVVHTMKLNDNVLHSVISSSKVYSFAMHPYAEDYVDDVLFHPTDISYNSVVAPSEVNALGVFGLIRPGKGIEAVVNLASTFGLDVYVHGLEQSKGLAWEIERLGHMVGVDVDVVNRQWSPGDVRSAVSNGVLPVIPSMSVKTDVIWASGTEADLIGCKVPYIVYSPFGGHNPCAYSVAYGGATHVSLYVDGVDGAVEKATEYVSKITPVSFDEFARALYCSL